jgi:hypothetical protein
MAHSPRNWSGRERRHWEALEMQLSAGFNPAINQPQFHRFGASTIFRTCANETDPYLPMFQNDSFCLICLRALRNRNVRKVQSAFQTIVRKVGASGFSVCFKHDFFLSGIRSTSIVLRWLNSIMSETIALRQDHMF